MNDHVRIESPWVFFRTRVPYGHTDKMGHVYYAHYLMYFEMARTEWMRAAGLTYRDFEEMGFIVPVAEAHVRYRGRVFYDDEIEIACAARLEGRTRIRFIYEVRRTGSEEVLTTGWSLHAVVDTNGRPVRVPPELKSLLDVLGSHPGDPS